MDSSVRPALAGRPNYRTIALIIASAMFMEQLDATVLATALPTMARSFGVSAPHMSIALTAYLLSLAVLIPASGKVADRFGSRSVFAVAIGIFTLGSILCAQAQSLPFLVFARLLQGAGGAMMMPVGRLVLLRSVDKRDLVSAMGWLLVPALIGPIVGPPVGGFIVTWLDWRWIFYINIPIGILGIVLVLMFIENVRGETREPFDVIGFVLSGVSLACLLFGFEMSSRGGEAGPFSLGLMVVGLVVGVAYVLHARRHVAPILDLSLMRIPTFRISVIAGSLSRITQGAQPFLLPLMLQIGFGLSAAESGLLTFATACGSMLMKGAAGRILKRYGFRTTLVWNSVASSLLYAACAAFRPDWPHAAIFAVLLVCGFSMSLQFTAYNTVAYDDIPASRTSAANSFYTTFQQLMLSFGICVGALALHASSVSSGHAHATVGDFSVAFLVVTAISLLASPVSALLPRDAGAVMSGHRAGGREEAAAT
ncbi:EmrB/QacA subfamily drug resistance transporter [Labrys wisconsinensis]|uniref:EmrB/QacA subfamily drug resistance transporter n=1 Tax=Labrys wisconsinensis TaxID=425677 RepID=A0ABU0JGY2_9HYPH|nr:MDR family MFS transporter [Labrys wisconsinensis]MDQ0472382.1 EmrB/QacA subfamily drug resistance transporter [Labrys wisconsinensis]